jgi:hypothetical protein
VANGVIVRWSISEHYTRTTRLWKSVITISILSVSTACIGLNSNTLARSPSADGRSIAGLTIDTILISSDVALGLYWVADFFVAWMVPTHLPTQAAVASWVVGHEDTIPLSNLGGTFRRNARPWAWSAV